MKTLAEFDPIRSLQRWGSPKSSQSLEYPFYISVLKAVATWGSPWIAHLKNPLIVRGSLILSPDQIFPRCGPKALTPRVSSWPLSERLGRAEAGRADSERAGECSCPMPSLDLLFLFPTGPGFSWLFCSGVGTCEDHDHGQMDLPDFRPLICLPSWASQALCQRESGLWHALSGPGGIFHRT